MTTEENIKNLEDNIKVLKDINDELKSKYTNPKFPMIGFFGSILMVLIVLINNFFIEAFSIANIFDFIGMFIVSGLIFTVSYVKLSDNAKIKKQLKNNNNILNDLTKKISNNISKYILLKNDNIQKLNNDIQKVKDEKEKLKDNKHSILASIVAFILATLLILLTTLLFKDVMLSFAITGYFVIIGSLATIYNIGKTIYKNAVIKYNINRFNKDIDYLNSKIESLKEDITKMQNNKYLTNEAKEELKRKITISYENDLDMPRMLKK